MIEIIERGNKKRITCKHCGAVLSYEPEDVKEEELVNIIFDRAYKILKNRYSSAERLNDTLRKIISSKISEMELTRNNNM